MCDQYDVVFCSQVMSVNLGMRDPDDLRWWGVNVSYYFYFVITFILS